MLSIDLSIKVAIVTGSIKGIGFGIAKTLAKAGCDIAGCDLSDNLDIGVVGFQNEIESLGRKVYYKRLDVRKEVDIELFIKDVIETFGKIDILVSNAGINMMTAPEACDSSFWDENFEINLKSHWLLSKACYNQLKINKGTIVLMGSNHAYSTLANCFPYNVAKSGIDGLVKSLAIQWGPNIRVVGLAPGFIETEGGENWFDNFENPEKKREEIINIHPLKRLGSVDEVGALCAFVCSPFASFITGATYLMDGGRSTIMQDI